MVGYNCLQKPTWLDGLLKEKFFSACAAHSNSKKNERNIYCLGCSVAICQHCLPHHPQSHKLLQIRRYVYHDVIRMQDIQKLIDCALVQPYIINSAKVVFLNQRPQPRPPKVQGNVCETCERSLQDSYKYCCLACKVEAAINRSSDLPRLLRPGYSSQIVDLNASSSSSLASPSESVSGTTKGDTCTVEDDEEQEQLSPNSIFGGPNLNSPTSSSSIATESSSWDSRAIKLHTSKHNTNANTLSRNICVFSSCKEQSLKQCNKISLMCASQEATFGTLLPCLKRRKGIPRRSPIF
ncbi:hypothetical protein GOP47_0013250 [Adiantum capillus-veneris]|uniref:B box-type domain-containing protein n=1 Tax=Adiantum capillus-veneris TaxID=13818 RepID=A0A9D4UN64_ADICA|nr:hypothetical protein GOP47_0013250 [Adiantum capillus-veneris]